MTGQVIDDRRRSPARDRHTVLVLAVGLVVVVVGTFLPWLRSGSVSRNSYATDGAMRRLLDVDGARGAALAAWPFVSLACAAAIALVLLGFNRSGTSLAVLSALCALIVAVAALSTNGNVFVRCAVLGPSVTIAGTALVWLAATARLLPVLSHRSARRPR